MSEQQMTLFQDAPERITEAINALNGDTVLLPNHEEFVCQLGTQLTTLPPGSVVLAAAPGAAAVGDLCDMLHIHLDEAHTRGIGPGSSALAVMSVPATSGVRTMRNALLDGYRDSPRFSSVRRLPAPQADLNLYPAVATVDPFRLTTALVSQRVSTAYYLLLNAHYLQRPGGSFMEAAEHVRFVMQLAAESRRTQVLLGNVSAVCRWLTVPEIADAVSLCTLRPYDLTDSGDLETFQRLLLNYHAALPWKGDPPLLNQIEAIDWAVCGCPVRLRKWMMATLIGAKARGVAELDWKFVSKFAPLAAERKTARDDFKAIQSLRGPLPKKGSERNDASGTKPFARPLTRPTVGFDAA